jgi:hypothetical protein
MPELTTPVVPAMTEPVLIPERDAILTAPASLSARSAAAVRPVARSWGRPLLILAGVVLVLAVAGVGYMVLSKPGPGSSQPQSLGLASASLDPDAPAFPVPAGSTLINATIDGSGPAAYRLEAWQSGQGFDATANFYADLVYSGRTNERWQAKGALSETPQAVTASFSDASGVFGGVELEVDRTNPVRIAVRFIPPGGAPAQTFGAGPTIAFAPLPAATALPDGFPAAFVPPGTTLYDASSIGTTYFAIFSGTVDPAAYLAQIKAVAPDARSSLALTVTAIDFTYDGQPGKAVVDAGAGQVSVEVTK